MSRPLPGPKIEFWTEAPSNAPEVKGDDYYFKPKLLSWSVYVYRGRVHVDVMAHGPAIREKYRRDRKRWSVEGTPEGDTRPSWLLLPLDKLARATLLVEYLTEEGDDDE